MFRSALTVTVPTPCQEGWENMQPTHQGRFCSSCQKTVVDFTAMTDAEVVKWLKKQKGETCGRFRSNQLRKELLAAATPNKNWNWKLVMLGLAGWLSAKTVEAKDQKPTQFIEQQTQPISFNETPKSQATQEPDSLLKINGRVIDAETKEGISGATVQLKGTTIAAPTDVNGYFQLDIPRQFRITNSVLVFSFIGVKTLEKSLSEALKDSSPIQLQPAEPHTITAGIVEIGVSNWHSPRGLFYKIKNLFR